MTYDVSLIKQLIEATPGGLDAGTTAILTYLRPQLSLEIKRLRIERNAKAAEPVKPAAVNFVRHAPKKATKPQTFCFR